MHVFLFAPAPLPISHGLLDHKLLHRTTKSKDGKKRRRQIHIYISLNIENCKLVSRPCELRAVTLMHTILVMFDCPMTNASDILILISYCRKKKKRVDVVTHRTRSLFNTTFGTALERMNE